jgi:pentalenene oxygenase
VKEIPKAPGAFPLLGHGVALARDPLKFLASLPARGDLVWVRLGPMKAVMICSPALVRQVLLDDRTYGFSGPVFDRIQEAVGASMEAPAEVQRKRRRLVQPAFSNARIRGYARTMTVEAGQMVDSWRDRQVIDVPEEMMTLTLATVMNALFAEALPASAAEAARADLDTLFVGFLRRALMPAALTRLPTPGNLRYRAAITRLRATTGSVITARRADDAGRDDLLSGLLATEPDMRAEGVDMSDETLTDLVISLFVAGVQSTASLLSWALYITAADRGLSDRLHEEVTAVAGDGPVTAEHVPELRVACQVMTETLRLYPPGWLLSRTATVDAELGDHFIPAGTAMLYSPYIIHSRSDIYPDPGRFDSSRWDAAKRTPPAPCPEYLPFGQGARKCLGDTFAFTEAVISLATILRRWRLDLTTTSPVRPALAIELKPSRLHLRLSARTSPAAPEPVTISH